MKAGFYWGARGWRGGQVSGGGFPPRETEPCPAFCVNRTEVDVKVHDGGRRGGGRGDGPCGWKILGHEEQEREEKVRGQLETTDMFSGIKKPLQPVKVVEGNGLPQAGPGSLALHLPRIRLAPRCVHTWLSWLHCLIP